MQFYVLGDLRTDDWTYNAHASGIKEKNQGDAPRCPTCGQYIGMLPWLPPYHAEILVYGSKLGDVVNCGGESRLVSNRFRQAWQDEGLRGIEEFSPLARLRIRPARLGRRPLTYFHVNAQHYGARVDLEHSLIEYHRPMTCNDCMDADVETVRGFAIDEASWTGEDLFTEGPAAGGCHLARGPCRLCARAGGLAPCRGSDHACQQRAQEIREPPHRPRHGRRWQGAGHGMIRYALNCSHDHGFEGWFKSGAAFEQQVADGQLACPACGPRLTHPVAEIAAALRAGGIVVIK